MKVATHSGSFHADDVFAVAALRLAFAGERLDLVRTRDEKEIATADIVLDVGRIYDGEKHFDHHQQGGAGARQNGIPYASFGLIWNKFSGHFVSKEISERIDRELVQIIDAEDNGFDVFESRIKGVADFNVSSVVALMNNTFLEPERNQDASFMESVNIAEKIIGRAIAFSKEFFDAKTEILKALAESDNKALVVVLRPLRRQTLYEVAYDLPELLFAVHPHENKHWAIRAVRKSSSSFESRKPLPANWGGKEGGELQKETGIAGALFCHRQLFTADAETKEDAVALAKIALDR